MRASAILMGIVALFLASCSVEPKSSFDARAALAKLKGPDTGTVQGTLGAQAQQAEDAGDFKRAAQIYRQMVGQSPDKVEYQIDLADSLRRAGDCQSASRVTERILKKNPKNADAKENKALCLMNNGDFEEAATVFGEVMKIDPKRWRTLNGIGILFAMKGKYDSAVAYYQEALNVSPDNPSVLNNAALTYAIDRQFGRAYEAFDRAKRHLPADSPDLKPLDLNLALVYAVDGKLDEAQEVAAPHLSKAALYNNMGFYSYLSKNNALAKGYLNMALTQSPVYYERAWKNMGALTGDMSGSSESQAMPANKTLENETTDLAAPTSHVTQTEIPLEDIPESKSIEGNRDPIVPINKPKAEVKTQAKEKTEKPTTTNKENEDGDSTNSAEKMPSDEDPDIVLIHKPAPLHNTDWDTDKKTDVDSVPNPPPIVKPSSASPTN